MSKQALMTAHRSSSPARRQCVPPHASAWALVLVTLLLLLVQSPARADAFQIKSAEVNLAGGVYYLNTRIDYTLSDSARDAMHNGVPLTFELQIEVSRPRNWWWDESVATLSQRYRIRYHDLSKRYVLTNLNTGAGRSFSHERAVLRALGGIDGLPVIDHRLLQPGEHELRFRARLDPQGLPQPLRTVALISRQWRLASEWFIWPLEV